MLFNSIDFLLFLVAVFGMYLVLPHRLQNAMLLVASYAFYAFWDYRFLSLILLSTFVDYTCALGMGRATSDRKRRALLTISIVVNLGLLGFFKYFGFFVENLVALADNFGVTLDPGTLSIVLPVGISFYTFQTMSYTIDVYRGRTKPTRNLLDFALYVAFFPQLVAGPIERSHHLLPQIAEPRRVTWRGVGSGVRLIAWGLYKKVVIADNLARLVDPAFAEQGIFYEPSAIGIWLALYAFAFQIYCDFSGYSDIARGVARMLGIDLMLNFRIPYIATGPRDFWRRWHISLSTWLRDYLYIPLGGDRKGRGRTLGNLLLTMLLGGLWHGAAWTFVIWGAIHGVWLVIHRLVAASIDAAAPTAGAARAVFRVACRVGTFHLVCVTWLFFRADDLGQASSMLSALATSWFVPEDGGRVFLQLLFFTTPLFLVQVFQARSDVMDPVVTWPWPLRWLFYAILFNVFLIWGAFDGGAFIYFQF